MNTTALYLEFEIHYHKDIKESSHSQEDKRWKQGQIDLLQRMVNEIDGIPEPTLLERLIEVGSWMDEDKGYSESTLEKQAEFARNRNYHITNTSNPVDFPKCNCHTCRPIDYTDPESVYMRLCPECGNKRCPKATNHTNKCTNSNDPGQEGSIYYNREWI
jgi:hypothetical protein